MNEQPSSIERTTLVFGVGKEEYAIDIAQVQELRGYDNVTRLANAPACLKGVTNLRGVIVPLIDLRIRLGQPDPTYDATTVVVVLNLGRHTVGIVVDRVADVVDLSPEQLRPAPVRGDPGTEHVLAIGAVGDRMLIVIDISCMLADFGFDGDGWIPPASATALQLAA